MCTIFKWFFIVLLCFGIIGSTSVITYSPLLPHTAQDVTRLVVYVHIDAKYPPHQYVQYFNNNTIATSTYGLERLAENTYSADPFLKWGAWAYDKSHVFSTDVRLWKYAQTPSPDEVTKILNLLFSLQTDYAVYWSSATSFVPSVGDLGLAVPFAEVSVLFNNNDIRWLVFGNTAYDNSYYVLVFPSFNRGTDQQPHPLGIFHLYSTDVTLNLYQNLYEASR